MALVLTGSVGQGGTNSPSDVVGVRDRLVSLGFTWVAGFTSMGPTFVKAIMLFQAIKSGRDKVYSTGVDGRVDPGGDTLKWLNATNAPRWQRMTAEDVGLKNDEITNTNDNHDYGTSWLDQTLRTAGRAYQDAWRVWNPTAARITVNDTSMPRGGDTPAHGGHETGLVCDLRLPRIGGSVGGITTASVEYDRATMRAQLRALTTQPLFEVCYLNDDELIREGLCRPLAGHSDHVHYEIRPPIRSA